MNTAPADIAPADPSAQPPGVLAPANNPAGHANSIPGSDDPDSAPRIPDSALDPLPLAPLARLTGETDRQFSAFFLYASADPRPSITDFARKHGFSRRSVTRWSSDYLWQGRIDAYYSQRSTNLVRAHEEASKTAAAQVQQHACATLDFRSETLALARRAIDAWLSDSGQQVTLQGLTRMLELAGRFNPPAEPDHEREQREDKTYREFLKSIEKVYGTPCTPMPASPSLPASLPGPSDPGSAGGEPIEAKLGQTEPNCAKTDAPVAQFGSSITKNHPAQAGACAKPSQTAPSK